MKLFTSILLDFVQILETYFLKAALPYACFCKDTEILLKFYFLNNYQGLLPNFYPLNSLIFIPSVCIYFNLGKVVKFLSGVRICPGLNFIPATCNIPLMIKNEKIFVQKLNLFVHICLSITKLYLHLGLPLKKCLLSGNLCQGTALVFPQDQTLTSKTNFYHQRTNFPIYSNSSCLICDSILVIKKLN